MLNLFKTTQTRETKGHVHLPSGGVVSITRSRRRTIAIHVRDGQVMVRAPHRAPLSDIQDFVRAKARWIEKKLSEHERRAGFEPVRVVEGAMLPFLGERLRLVTLPARSTDVFRDGDALILEGPKSLKGPGRLKAVEGWYRDVAHDWLSGESHALAARIGKKVQGIEVKSYKARWGQCSHKGVLAYNWRIMMAPEAVARYVVAHEVSHLRHMNHSARFWQVVESLHPDWKVQRRWLRNMGHTLCLKM